MILVHGVPWGSRDGPASTGGAAGMKLLKRSTGSIGTDIPP